jgi:CheY-like chemotaxis protein
MSRTPIGKHREEQLTASLHALRELADEFDAELVHVNDRHLRPQAGALVLATRQLTTRHTPVLRPTIADDLTGLMNGAKSFRMPSSDPDLGRTSTLDRLRKYKGLLIASLTDALDAAQNLGLHPGRFSTHDTISVDFPREDISHLLQGIASRLAEVENTLGRLEAAKLSPNIPPQETDLLASYTDSMRLEVDLAKVHLGVGTESINIASLAHTIDVMAELTADFFATVRAWTSWLSKELVKTAGTIRKSVSRLTSGVKVTVLWILREDRKKKLGRLAAANQKTTTENGTHTPAAKISSAGRELKSAAVARHLPFLRRYARTVTGSQTSGDTYVSGALEAIIDNPKLVTEEDPKISLYRLFTRIYNAAPPTKGAAGEQNSPFPDQMAPAVRQAFALNAIEGFSEEDVAQVLELEVAEVRRLIAQAGRDLATRVATDVLIIEPETFIAEDLQTLAESLGHRIIGIARTYTEALSMARATKPGAILAEIQLADGSSGLEAVNDILKFAPAAVIFATAYPERFLAGPRPEPAFLLAKPYQPQMLSAVLSQALFFERRARPPRSLS